MQLADTSAWIWTRSVGGEIKTKFDEALIEGQIATCDMVKMELLYSARNRHEFDVLRSDLEAVPDCPINKTQWQRSIDVYQELAGQGGLHHRSVKHADLLIAAAAEQAGIPVLHYDEDFERIAAITGQHAVWLAERGSLKP